MLDLNTLIAPGSGLQLTNAFNINDRGEILTTIDSLGVTPIDDEDLGHVVLPYPMWSRGRLVIGERKRCEVEHQRSIATTAVSGLSKHNVPQQQRGCRCMALRWLASIDFPQLY
jgi:hypothetical protein